MVAWQQLHTGGPGGPAQAPGEEKEEGPEGGPDEDENGVTHTCQHKKTKRLFPLPPLLPTHKAAPTRCGKVVHNPQCRQNGKLGEMGVITGDPAGGVRDGGDRVFQLQGVIAPGVGVDVVHCIVTTWWCGLCRVTIRIQKDIHGKGGGNLERDCILVRLVAIFVGWLNLVDFNIHQVGRFAGWKLGGDGSEDHCGEIVFAVLSFRAQQFHRRPEFNIHGLVVDDNTHHIINQHTGVVCGDVKLLIVSIIRANTTNWSVDSIRWIEISRCQKLVIPRVVSCGNAVIRLLNTRIAC